MPCDPHGPNRFTADGRFLAYVNRSGRTVRTIWWDRIARRMVGEFEGVEMSAMAGNGRWVSIGEPEAGQPVELTFRESVTGRKLGHFRRQQPFDDLQFSPDGNYLVIKDASGLSIVKTSSRRLVVNVPADPLENVIGAAPRKTEIVWPSGGTEAVFVETGWTEMAATRFDLRTGRGQRRSIFQDQEPNFGGTTGVPIRGSGLLMVHYRQGRPLTGLRWWLARLPILGSAFEDASPCMDIYDARSGKELLIHALPNGLNASWSSPDGDTLLVQGDNGQIDIWDLPPRAPLLWTFLAASGTAVMVALATGLWTRRLQRRTV